MVMVDWISLLSDEEATLYKRNHLRRQTGVAFCTMCGRFGSMSAPMIYAALVKEGGNDNPFYIYAAALPALASVLLITLQYDSTDDGDVLI